MRLFLPLSPASRHGLVSPASIPQNQPTRAAFGTSHAKKPPSTPDFLVQAASLLNHQKHFDEFDGHGTLMKKVVLKADASFEGISPQLWQHSFSLIQSAKPVQDSLNRQELGILEEVADLRYELIGLIAHKKGLIPQSLINHVDQQLQARPNTSVLTFLPEFKRQIADPSQQKEWSQKAKALARLVYGSKDKVALEQTYTLMALTAIRYSQLGFATRSQKTGVPEGHLIQQLHGELAEMVSNLPLFNKATFRSLLDDKNLTIQQHPRLSQMHLEPNESLSHDLKMVLTHIDNHQTQVLAQEFQATQTHLIGILKQTLGLQSLSKREMLAMMDDYYLKKHLIRQEFNLILPELSRDERKKRTKLFEAVQEAEIINAARSRAAATHPARVAVTTERPRELAEPQTAHA